LPRPSKLSGQAAEVADAGQRDGEQPVEEVPHAVAAQGHLRADRHALAQLEPAIDLRARFAAAASGR
jgi:hypothetical protein